MLLLKNWKNQKINGRDIHKNIKKFGVSSKDKILGEHKLKPQIEKLVDKRIERM